MASDRRTGFEPESGESLYGSSTLPLETARPEPRQPSQVFFPALHDYASDRRSDVRARDYSDCIKLPYRDGYLEKFKRIADAGFYFIELRAGNKIVGDEGVIEIAPNMHSAAQPAPVERQPSEQQPASSARSINDTTETIRATKELLKEVAPSAPAQQPTPQLTEEKIAEIVAREIAKHQPQPATQPLDPFSMLERSVKLVNDMRPTPAQTPTSSPSEQLEQTVSMVEQVTNIVERLSPQQQQASGDGWLNGIANVLNALGVKDVLKPIGQIATSVLLSRGIQMPDANAQQAAQPQQPAQTYQPTPMQQPVPQFAPAPESAAAADADEETPLTLDSLLGNYVQDIVENRQPKQSISDTIQFVVENPNLAPVIAQLMEQPSASLLASLSQATGKDLSVIANAEKFVDGLKKGVRARLVPLQAASAQMNGNGAQTQTTATIK